MASDLCLWANKGTGMRTGFGTPETYSRYGRTPPLEEQKGVQLLVTAAVLVRSGLAIKLVLLKRANNGKSRSLPYAALLKGLRLKVLHRITVSVTPKINEELLMLGVIAVPDSLGLTTFVIDESDRRWPDLQRWLADRHLRSLVSTEFTADEIGHAQWADLTPDWHYGYPQPVDDYKAVTYDCTDHCEQCGIGAIQREPFRLKGEPKWGRRSIFQLNWVFDEYFVTPTLWETILKPLGVECRSVLNTKGKELSTVVQVVVREEVGITHERLSPTRCALCGRIKYLPHRKGFFPPLEQYPSGDIAKTREYFGSGASAYKSIVVSRTIVAAFVAHGVRGVSFCPLSHEEGKGVGSLYLKA